MRAVLTAPVSRRSRRELLFCASEMPFAFPLPLVVFFVTILLAQQLDPRPNPSGGQVLVALTGSGLTVVLLPATGAARGLAALCRRLAASLLGELVPAPAAPAGRRLPGRMAARLGDRPSWRAVGYLALKFPVSLLGWYAVSFWLTALIALSYPFWWLSFRNHRAGVHLSPVPVFTPLGWGGRGTFEVATFPGTFAAFAVGAAMLLAAPWATRTVAAADRWLIQGLLGPGTLRERLRDLEQTRALAVDNSAALLRQVERNLHDGAQIRLATLAMNLGMAQEKLAAAGDPAGGTAVDLAAVRELVDAARQGAKDALSELRELARGIHPPVLDNGLADALTTLAAGSAIPATLTVDISRRPTPAIESIAFFCAAELLANAVKHSSASKVQITVTERAGALLLTVADDGTGRADPAGGGLSGLAQRIRTVDGRMDITSPAGGPTRIRVELPLRA
jgi:signal transduction histidine kinase